MKDSRVYDYLNALEFYTLIAASGREKWYGPMLEKEKRINSQDALNRLMAGLYQKGSIEWGEDSAVFTDRFRKAFTNIRDSKDCIVVKRFNVQAETFFAYPGRESITQISVSKHDVDAIRITAMDLTEWIDELEEENVFPELIGSVPDSVSLGKREIEPHAVLELRDAGDGGKKEELIVIDEGLYAVLVHNNRIKKRTSLCIRSEYEQVLKEWAGKEAE